MTFESEHSITETAGWITIDQAAQLSGYEPAYIRQLMRQGRIPRCRVGNGWLIHRDALEQYKAQMDALGKSKHDPWRPELAAQGRGRRSKTVDQDS